MIHPRTHMYEETKKALAKAKRIINKMTYEEMTKENVKKVLDSIFEENKGDDWFEPIKFYDRITRWVKKTRDIKWLEYLDEIRKSEQNAA